MNLKPKLIQALQELGITSRKQFSVPLRQAVIRAKLSLLAIDLTMLATKGVIFYYARNWLTENLSGQKGFSGVLNYSTSIYRENKAKIYDETKKKRLFIAASIGIISSLILPLALNALLKIPAKLSKGVIGRLKNLIPKFDYIDVIYMSKWTLLYSQLFHYNIPKLLFSRDNNELRENLVRTFIYDFFYFFGDNLFSGLLYIQNKK